MLGNACAALHTWAGQALTLLLCVIICDAVYPGKKGNDFVCMHSIRARGVTYK